MAYAHVAHTRQFRIYQCTEETATMLWLSEPRISPQETVFRQQHRTLPQQ
eukprot:m.299887 g.299887  ORF g.299887 m.299887 type:complete len:50 (-) comp20123_c1_seq15:246-395(-)